MAIRFTLGFEESWFTINGASALHMVCAAAEPADGNNIYSFDVTLRSTNGLYSQSWSDVLLPDGQTSVSVPFVPPLEWANDFSQTLGDIAHEDACGQFVATMTAHYTMHAGTVTYSNDYTGYAASLSATVAADILPSVGELTAEEAGGRVPAEWGVWVQNQSAVRITAPHAAGRYGASIVAYRFGTGGAQAENTADLPLTAAGTVTIPVTVEDSRGRIATQDLLLEVQPYAPPALTEIRSRRCTEEGVQEENGTCFSAGYTLSVSTLEGKNPVTVQCAWKKVTDSAYGTPLALEKAGQVIPAELEPGASYDVRYTVSDAFYTIAYQDYVSSTVYLLHFRKGGTGIAVGKAAEADDLFDVGLPARFRREAVAGAGLQVVGSLLLGDTDVSAALQEISTVTAAAMTLDADHMPAATENQVIKCGRLMLARLRGALQNGGEPPYEGESYPVARLPEGCFSASWPALAVACQNGKPCRAEVSPEGIVSVTPAADGQQDTEITILGIV